MMEPGLEMLAAAQSRRHSAATGSPLLGASGQNRKGMKRPRDNADNPGPRTPQFSSGVAAAIYPCMLLCVDKLATKRSDAAQGLTWAAALLLPRSSFFVANLCSKQTRLEYGTGQSVKGKKKKKNLS